MKKTLNWIARILAIALIAFFSLFALDVFGQPGWFLGLIMHLIPSFILIIITVIAWKNETAIDTDIVVTLGDIRELQKAKGAIRAAMEVLMAQLGLKPKDLQHVILTGSFGGAVDLQAVLALGMIPPVAPQAVETIANGAGFGAAQFLSDEGFARGGASANKAEQIDLNTDAQFIEAYVASMIL